MTQVELARHLKENGAGDLNQVVMIQCVGSRNEENPNCSRICCQTAIKNALNIKKLNPEAEVYILYRDIRTYGLLEDYYKEAREKGVFFFPLRRRRTRPEVESARQTDLVFTFQIRSWGDNCTCRVDLLALSAGMVAEIPKSWPPSSNWPGPPRAILWKPMSNCGRWIWPPKGSSSAARPTVRN